MTTTMTTTTARLGAVILTAAITCSVTFSGCGSDDDTSMPAPSAPASSDPIHHEDATVVTIEGVDYGFNDVPSSVPAGTRLAFRNAAPAELHELVVFRLSDGDDIALGDLAQLPAEELGPRLGAPVTVLLQPPGSDEQIVAVGDGTLEEPGRYVLMCFIPTGADPQEYLAAAAASDGEAPTGVAGGPPHFVNGMYAELQVDA
jgi:hypothetical protein